MDKLNGGGEQVAWFGHSRDGEGGNGKAIILRKSGNVWGWVVCESGDEWGVRWRCVV